MQEYMGMKELWKKISSLQKTGESNDINTFIDCVLGLMFYKYISDKEENEFKLKFNSSLKDIYYEEKEDILQEKLDKLDLNYLISPKYLFTVFTDKAKDRQFNIDDIKKGFMCLCEINNLKDLEIIFNEFDRVNDVKIKKLIILLSEIDYNMIPAYYLQFAAGMIKKDKKTNKICSTRLTDNLLCSLATVDLKDAGHVYNPLCDYGSLLVLLDEKLKKRQDEPFYYAEEDDPKKSALAKMNLIMHDINRFKINQDISRNTYDLILAYLPRKYEQESRLIDPTYLKNASSYLDCKVIKALLARLKETGSMILFLSQRFLFAKPIRNFRREIVEENHFLDTVIRTPDNLSPENKYCICIFKKDKQTGNVYFIDAEHDYKKSFDPQVATTKIIQAYITKTNIDEFAYLASSRELAENDFNLTISRYVKKDIEEDDTDYDEKKQLINHLSILCNEYIDKEIAVGLKEMEDAHK